MTRKDFVIIAKILGQIAYTEKHMGLGVFENSGAIDEYLQSTNANYKSDTFWQAVNKELAENEKIL